MKHIVAITLKWLTDSSGLSLLCGASLVLFMIADHNRDLSMAVFEYAPVLYRAVLFVMLIVVMALISFQAASFVRYKIVGFSSVTYLTDSSFKNKELYPVQWSEARGTYVRAVWSECAGVWLSDDVKTTQFISPALLRALLFARSVAKITVNILYTWVLLLTAWLIAFQLSSSNDKLGELLAKLAMDASVSGFGFAYSSALLVLVVCLVIVSLLLEVVFTLLFARNGVPYLEHVGFASKQVQPAVFHEETNRWVAAVWSESSEGWVSVVVGGTVISRPIDFKK